MEINIVTIVLGMIVSFTLPLLIVSCVLVYIHWSGNAKTISSDVEAVSTNLNPVIKHTESPKIIEVIHNLYTLIQKFTLLESDNVQSSLSLSSQNRLNKVASVASKLIKFGRIRDIEGLDRLTSHLTGVVIILNPVPHHEITEQETEEKSNNHI